MRALTEQNIAQMWKVGKPVKSGGKIVNAKIDKPEVKVEKEVVPEKDLMLEAVTENGKATVEGLKELAKSAQENAKAIKSLGDKIVKPEPRIKKWSCVVERDRKGLIQGLTLEGA